MSYCTLQGWYGRFGNNIQQISNGIYYAMENNICFISPEHQLVRGFKFNNKENNNCVLKSNFYDFIKCSNNNYNLDFSCNVEKLNLNRDLIVKKIIRPNLKIDINSFEPLPSNEVVMHIRTGDIFISNPHILYVQNPLSFYQKIIDKYDKVYIVCENTNFIVDLLLQNSKVVLHSKSIEEDLSLIMRAQNVVSSGVGTFVIAASMLSTNIKNFYCTNLYLEDHLNPTMLSKDINVNMTNINLEKYIKIGDWKNNEEQRQIMLKYDLERGY